MCRSNMDKKRPTLLDVIYCIPISIAGLNLCSKCVCTQIRTKCSIRHGVRIHMEALASRKIPAMKAITSCCLSQRRNELAEAYCRDLDAWKDHPVFGPVIVRLNGFKRKGDVDAAREGVAVDSKIKWVYSIYSIRCKN